MTLTLVPPRASARMLAGSPWKPRWGKHVSQWIHRANGTRDGGDGCAEAAIARAILEYDPTTPERVNHPEWALVRRIHDPADPATPHDLRERISILARGVTIEDPNAGETTEIGIQAALDAFGLAWTAHYVSEAGQAAWDRAYASPLSLIWVDGSILTNDYMSQHYFDGVQGRGNHIMTWLPNPDGLTPNLVNNPLCDAPDEVSDSRESLARLNQAFYGCWVLPAPESLASPYTYVKQACAGKRWPNPFGKPVNAVLAKIAAGSQVTPTGYTTPNWAEITYGGAKMFVKRSNLATG